MKVTNITMKWYEVDAFENRTFSTMQDYVVTIVREAIPIIFVPGIMGSRLIHTKDQTPAWDPDTQNVMLKNFLGETESAGRTC